jgi:hypothetical protein
MMKVGITLGTQLRVGTNNGGSLKLLFPRKLQFFTIRIIISGDPR